MGLSVVTPATAWPVSLSDATAFARAYTGVDDAVVQMLLDAAMGKVSELIGRPLGQTVFQLSLDDFADTIELPRAPVSGTVSIAYTDQNNTAQTVPVDDYDVDLVSVPARVVLADGASWPEVASAPNVVRINFTAGYTQATLPPQIRSAVLALVARWYDKRDDMDVPEGVHALLADFRTLWLC